MKTTLYLTYALRSLARGGQRTLFAIFCVAIGVLAIVSLQLVGIMLNASLTQNIRALNGGDIAVHMEGAGLTPAQLTYFAALEDQGTISAYTAVPEDSANTSTAAGYARYTVYAVDPTTFPLSGPPRFITPADGSLSAILSGNRVVVTSALAQQLALRPGSGLTFTTDSGRTATLTVGGVIDNMGIFTQPLLLMSQAQYAALPNLTGAPTGSNWVYVDVPGHGDATAADVASQIRYHLPLVTANTVRQTLQDNEATIENIRTFLRILGLLALLIGGVGIVNTMQVLLRRRLLEVAMLKTAGYRQRDLIALFGLEAALLGLAGGALGAAAGVGVSLLVKTLVQQLIFITLPTIIDPLTVASGVAIGVATAVIFGLLPIAQASQVQPIAVLRELREEGGWRRALATLGLVAILAGLFFLLALSILRNPLIAVAVVLGSGVLLFALALFFGMVAWSISKFPVPEAFRWWHAPVAGVVVAACVGLTLWSSGFGLPLLALALCGLAAAWLPRTWKANVRLALRNIGRQKVRTATTLVALFGGVFGIGLGLALGQEIKSSIDQLANSRLQFNAYVLARSTDHAQVERQLAHSPGINREQVNLATTDQEIAINGVPLQQVLLSASGSADSGSGVGLAAGTSVSGIDGYDLAAGQTPPVTIEQGLQDTRKGRTLAASDSTTTATLVPVEQSQAPLRLKLGDQITIGNGNGNHPTTMTLNIVGFYTGGSFAGLSPLLVDQHVVTDLSGAAPLYVYSLRLDPATADQTLRRVKAVVPGAITLSIAATIAAIDQLLDSLVALVETVASLGVLAGLTMIANAVALALLERQREMGILKAVGYSSCSVLSAILLENAVVGIAGALMAMLLVTVAFVLLRRFSFRFATGQGVAPGLVLGLIAATVVVCVGIATGVAWRATRVRPIEVLRYE